MSVGAQVGSNFTLSTASYETITPGSQPTNLVTAYLAGGGQTLDAGSYLLFITNPIDLALPEYLNDGKGIFIINQPLADGATYKPIGNGFDLGVALSNSVPEPVHLGHDAGRVRGARLCGLSQSERATRRDISRVAPGSLSE
jgi:hypothetical protein